MLVVSQCRKILRAGLAPLALCCTAACGEQATTPVALPGAATARAAVMEEASAAPEGATCDFEGDWALRVQMKVRWDSNVAMQSGEGTITQYARVHRRRGDNPRTIEETIQPCGVVVPSLRRMVIDERHLFNFSSEMFDIAEARIMPSHVASSYTADFGPQSSFFSEFAALQLGVSLQNPITDDWPKPEDWRDILPNAIQVDGAGEHLGMPSTSVVKKGQFVRPQLSLMPGNGRLKQAFFAVRNVERIIARHTSCDRAEGSVEVYVKQNGKSALDLALIDCVKTRNQSDERCSDTDVSNFNYYLPEMRPVPGESSVVMVRIPAQMKCQDIAKNKELYQSAAAPLPADG